MRYSLAITVAALLLVPNAAFGDDLIKRFEALSPAIVHIETDEGNGTGVFIDDRGRIVTAAHVVTNRSFTHRPDGKFSIKITKKPNIRITTLSGKIVTLDNEIDISSLAARENATYDLALIETGIKPERFIPIGRPDKAKIGSRLLSIGFPGSSPEMVLYEGFLSSRHASMHTLGPIVNEEGKAATNEFDVLRLQMPITPGVSGAPVIDERNGVIAIVIEVPVIVIPDLQTLLKFYSEPSNRGGVLFGSVDPLKLIAQLAYVVNEFESPGSGLAVPVSYLNEMEHRP